MLNNTKKMTVLLIIGALLSVGSFLCYYLIQPTSWLIVSLLGVIDFIYTFLNAYLLFDSYTNKRLLKAIGLSAGYILLFNIIPIGYLLINGATTLLSEIWTGIIVYSFFTGPCLIVLIFLIALILIFIGTVSKFIHRQ